MGEPTKFLIHPTFLWHPCYYFEKAYIPVFSLVNCQEHDPVYGTNPERARKIGGHILRHYRTVQTNQT